MSHNIKHHRAFISLLARRITTHGQEDVATSLSPECKLLEFEGYPEALAIEAKSNSVINCTNYRVWRSSFRVMDSNVWHMFSVLRSMSTKRRNV